MFNNNKKTIYFLQFYLVESTVEMSHFALFFNQGQCCCGKIDSFFFCIVLNTKIFI